MSDYQLNPLHVLSHEYNWADYKIFRAHLQLPTPYVRIALKNFSPFDAVFNLSKIISKYHKHLWEKNVEPTFAQKMYQVANIPPQYHKPEMFICEKPADQENLDYVIANTNWLANNGKQFYFHGPYGEEPMKAAAAIVRSCTDNKIKCYCENYPAFLDTIKTWDLEDEKLKRIRTTTVLVLWAVGGEWTTEFTNTHLEALLSVRSSTNLTTILVSALNPKEYQNRYKAEPPGITVSFRGTKTKETLAMLKKEMESVV